MKCISIYTISWIPVDRKVDLLLLSQGNNTANIHEQKAQSTFTEGERLPYKMVTLKRL